MDKVLTVKVTAKDITEDRPLTMRESLAHVSTRTGEVAITRSMNGMKFFFDTPDRRHYEFDVEQVLKDLIRSITNG